VHTLFRETRTVTAGPLNLQLPQLDSIRPVPVAIAIIAAVLIFKAKWSVLRVLGVCAVLGLIAGLLGLPGI
jgi:chromate transporter